MGKMYRRWDKFEVQDVIARYLSGEDVQAIAEEYGRSVRSIEMMIYRQGLSVIWHFLPSGFLPDEDQG